MVGFTPSLSTAVWVGTTEGTKPLENKSGSAGVRVGPAVGHLEGDDGRCARGHRQRVVPEAGRDRRLCRCAAGAATAAVHRAAAAVGDGDSADDRSGAGHHDPVRPADHGARRPPPARRPDPPDPVPPGAPVRPDRAGPPSVTDRRRRPVTDRRDDRGRRGSAPAGRAGVAGSRWPTTGGALDDRDLPSRTDDRRGAVAR